MSIPKTKRGFLLSLGVLLFCIAVAGFTASLNWAVLDAQASNAHLLSIDRTTYKHENVTDNIADMLQEIAGISYEIRDYNITVTEWLPDTGNERKDTYVVSVAAYEKFAQKFSDNLDINITDDEIALTSLVIQPGNITYRHSGMSRNRKAENEIWFESTEPVFQSFYIEVTPQTGDLVDIAKSCPSSGTGTIDLVVTIYPKNKPVYTDGCYNFGASGYAEVWVDATGQATKDVNVTFDNGTLHIVNDKTVPVKVSSTLTLSEYPRIGIPEGSVVVKDAAYGTEKR